MAKDAKRSRGAGSGEKRRRQRRWLHASRHLRQIWWQRWPGDNRPDKPAGQANRVEMLNICRRDPINIAVRLIALPIRVQLKRKSDCENVSKMLLPFIQNSSENCSKNRLISCPQYKKHVALRLWLGYIFLLYFRNSLNNSELQSVSSS